MLIVVITSFDVSIMTAVVKRSVASTVPPAMADHMSSAATMVPSRVS